MKVLIPLVTGVLLITCGAQIVCRPQTLAKMELRSPITISLDLHQNNLRRRQGPTSAFLQRSIVQCESTVEVLNVPDNVTEYEGVPLGAVVTIVETEVPLRDSIEAAQRALPACTGIFISPTQILSSAHCVYHQRQSAIDEPFWMYGDDNPQNTFLYAIAGKVNAEDKIFDVYNLVQGCVPQSYVDAENEEATSVMGNDLVIFGVEGRFAGDPLSVGTIASSVVYDIPYEYMLPQYPSDVNDGRSLVIDKNTAPILFEPLGSGVFFSVELASWSGSSGGPIIDMNATRINGTPAVVGVLMSSGWEVCDSGIVPVSTGIPIIQELIMSTSNARNGRGNGSVNSNVSRGEAPSGPLDLLEESQEPLESLAFYSTRDSDDNDILPIVSSEVQVVRE